MLSFISFFLYDVLVLMYLYSFITSRGRAILRISVALLSCSSRGRALCYCVSFLYFCRAIRAAFTSRCDSIIMRRSTSALIKPRIILALSVADVTASAHSCPCSLALFSISLSVGPAASLFRSKSARLCCSRLANTTRRVVVRSYFVDSPPRLWEVESVAGTSWYSPRYLAAGHFTS